MKILQYALIILAILAFILVINYEVMRIFNFPFDILSQDSILQTGKEDVILGLIDSTLKNSAFVLQFVGWTVSLIAIIATILGLLGIKEIFNLRKARIEIENEHKEYKNSVTAFENKINKRMKREYDFIRAKIFYTQGFDEEAWEVLSEMPDDSSYEICMYKGMVLVRRKDYSDAITSFENALKFENISNTDKARIYFNMARCWLDNGQYLTAIEKFDNAISLKSNYWAAYNNKAVALRRLGRIDDAIKELHRIISIDKKHDTALYNLACYYSLENRSEEAIKYLKESIQLNTKKKKQAKGDPDFAHIRNDKRFNELVDDGEGK